MTTQILNPESKCELNNDDKEEISRIARRVNDLMSSVHTTITFYQLHKSDIINSDEYEDIFTALLQNLNSKADGISDEVNMIGSILNIDDIAHYTEKSHYSERWKPGYVNHTSHH